MLTKIFGGLTLVMSFLSERFMILLQISFVRHCIFETAFDIETLVPLWKASPELLPALCRKWWV